MSLNNALMSICDEESAHVRSRGSAIEELQQLIMWNHTTSNMYIYIIKIDLRLSQKYE